MKRVLALLVVASLTACGGGGGGSSTAGPVTSSVKVTLSAVANLNGTTDLSWSSTNATACDLSGSTTSSVPVNGTRRVTAPIIESQTYTIKCSGGGQSSAATETPVLPSVAAENCNAGSAPETHMWLSNIILMNNAWGVNSVGVNTATRVQCVKGNVTNNTINAEWEWNFDNSQGIKSYPSIVHGLIGPGWASTTKNLPAKISTLSDTYGVTYSESVSGTDNASAYNFLIDLYFNRSDAVNNDIEMSIAQVCVNTCHGQVSDIVTINNTVYRVYVGTNVDGKTHISFASVAVPQYSGNVTFKPFIDYAVARGYMTAAWNLSQVTVGNEVYSGKGKAVMSARFNN